MTRLGHSLRSAALLALIASGLSAGRTEGANGQSEAGQISASQAQPGASDQGAQSGGSPPVERWRGTVRGTLVTIRAGGDSKSEQYALIYRDPVSGRIVAGRWKGARPKDRPGVSKVGDRPGPEGTIPRADTIGLGPETLQWLLPDPLEAEGGGAPSGLMQAVLSGERAALIGLSDPAEFARRRAEALEKLNAWAGGGQTPVTQDYSIQISRTARDDPSNPSNPGSQAHADMIPIGGGRSVLIPAGSPIPTPETEESAPGAATKQEPEGEKSPAPQDDR